MSIQQKDFKQRQLEEARVKTAYAEKEKSLQLEFEKQKLDFNKFEIFIRGFKKEATLEVWVKDSKSAKFVLFKTYDFCSTSGTLGPKRKEGDLQIPEGIYTINHFNPRSNFLLSLGLSYPNESDKLLGDKHAPGSAIYIHGNCVTVGCIPITDDKIQELYLLAVEAKAHGQHHIPVHVFPTRLSDAGLSDLIRTEGEKHEHFWKNLQLVYTDFETHKTLSRISVNSKGQYELPH